MSQRVRRARSDDQIAIESLNRRTDRTLSQMWSWEEYLEHDLFIVVEQEKAIVGAVFVWPDESPVAWVRMAALDDTLGVHEWLNLTLPPVLNRLRRRGIQTLAWMDCGGWAGPHLEMRGFDRLAEVVTLAKFDHALPDTSAPGAHVRPASEADVPAIVTVERAAFTPHWWHSEATTRRAVAASSYFAVVELGGEVVGYAGGELHLPTAHLNRIAVHPTHQGRGIGALLLRDALQSFWRQGTELVTLNTQTENRRSQRLYRRFGFEPTGDSMTAWELNLS